MIDGEDDCAAAANASHLMCLQANVALIAALNFTASAVAISASVANSAVGTGKVRPPHPHRWTEAVDDGDGGGRPFH